jgi:hypothetical protein
MPVEIFVPSLYKITVLFQMNFSHFAVEMKKIVKPFFVVEQCCLYVRDTYLNMYSLVQYALWDSWTSLSWKQKENKCLGYISFCLLLYHKYCLCSTLYCSEIRLYKLQYSSTCIRRYHQQWKMIWRFLVNWRCTGHTL